MESVNRHLYDEWDRYESDDEIEKVLIRQMIENLKEVQDAILQAMQTNSLDIFIKIYQKIRPTITVLDNKELSDSFRTVNSEFFNEAKKTRAISNLVFVCNHIITRLRQDQSLALKNLKLPASSNLRDSQCFDKLCY